MFLYETFLYIKDKSVVGQDAGGGQDGGKAYLSGQELEERRKAEAES